MDTQGAKSVFGSRDGGKRAIHAEIPQSNLAIAAARDEFSQATTLHVDIGNPLLMLTPNLDHRCSWLETLVKDTNGAITEARDENVASNLVRCQRCDAGTGACGDVLR